jgi:hypothetical protein
MSRGGSRLHAPLRPLVLLVSVAATALLISIRAQAGGGETLFWSQSPTGRATDRGSIGFANLTPFSRGRIAAGARSPAGVAVGGGYAYWANFETGVISRIRIDGTGVDGHLVTTSAYSTIGVAVDSRHVYWTSAGGDANIGWIGRANLDGTSVQPHFIRGGDQPTGLAVTRDHLYWTHRDVHLAATTFSGHTRSGGRTSTVRVPTWSSSAFRPPSTVSLRTADTCCGRTRANTSSAARISTGGTSISAASMRTTSLGRTSPRESRSTAVTSIGPTTQLTRSAALRSMELRSISTMSLSAVSREGSPWRMARRHGRRGRVPESRAAALVGPARRLPGVLRGRLGRRGSCGDREWRCGGERTDLCGSLGFVGWADRARTRTQSDVPAARGLLPVAGQDRASCVGRAIVRIRCAARLYETHGT